MTPQGTEEDPDNREPADKRDTQIEYSSDYLSSPSMTAVKTYISIDTI
jgi:hypothetical protein